MLLYDVKFVWGGRACAGKCSAELYYLLLSSSLLLYVLHLTVHDVFYDSTILQQRSHITDVRRGAVEHYSFACMASCFWLAAVGGQGWACLLHRRTLSH